MTVIKASAKANMTFKSGSYYYNKYLNNPDHNIPIPRFLQNYKQDQNNKFIGYIISDKVNITEASTKAKINRNSGIYYYHKHFDVQNPDIATPSHIASYKNYKQEKINELIGYIVDNKMTIKQLPEKQILPTISKR